MEAVPGPRKSTKVLTAWAILLFSFAYSSAEMALNSPASFSDTMPNVRINSDATGQTQNEEMIAINPLNPDQVVAVWRDFRLGYRQVGHGYSTDGGATWSDQLFDAYNTFPAFTWESDPVLGVDKNGNFIAATIGLDPSMDFSDIFVYRSTDGGQTWSAPTRVVNADSGFEDKEWMAIDRSPTSPYADNIYSAWARFSPDFSSVRIMFAASEDTAQTWTVKPLTDAINGVQWPTVACDDSGYIYVAWMHNSPPSLRMRISYDGGATFTPDQTLVSIVDGFTILNGDVLAFSFPALGAVISDSAPYQNNVYIAYMDAPSGDADIFFIKSTDRGATWNTPHRINDDKYGNGLDQFHPWISVNEDGVVSVVFLDRRNDPNNQAYDLYLTQSFDAGQTWTPNLRISNDYSFPLSSLTASTGLSYDPLKEPMASSPLAGLIGEYVGVSSLERRVNMAWTDTRLLNQDAFGSRFMGLHPPVPLVPADSAYVNDKTPFLQWAPVGYYDTATSFTLQLSLIDPEFGFPETTVTGLTGDIYQIPTADSLFEDGDYYWRVKGYNSSGDSSLYSRPFLFGIDTEPPSTPVLLSPPDDTSSRDSLPSFDWETVTAQGENAPTGAPVRYSLQISFDDSLFGGGYLQFAELQTSQYQLGAPLDNDRTYYWRVQAYDLASNFSNWSGFFKFYLRPLWIDGDASGDGEITLSDVIFLVNYIFNKPGNWIPDPIEAGDLNCDALITLADAIHLVNYIFNKPGNWNPCIHP